MRSSDNIVLVRSNAACSFMGIFSKARRWFILTVRFSHFRAKFNEKGIQWNRYRPIEFSIITIISWALQVNQFIEMSYLFIGAIFQWWRIVGKISEKALLVFRTLRRECSPRGRPHRSLHFVPNRQQSVTVNSNLYCCLTKRTFVKYRWALHFSKEDILY